MDELDRITFFRSYYDAEQQLETRRDRLSFLEGILIYAFEGRIPEMTGAANMLFSVVKPNIESSKKRSAAKKKGRKTRAETPAESGENGEIVPTACGDNDLPKNKEIKNTKNNRKEKTEKRKYGEYGWVLLSEGQYGKLSEELGEEELKACIRYVDESAQKTGNKNGWKDWNLVIRNCHRDGWHRRAERRTGYGSGRVSGAAEKPEQEWDIVYD